VNKWEERAKDRVPQKKAQPTTRKRVEKLLPEGGKKKTSHLREVLYLGAHGRK